MEPERLEHMEPERLEHMEPERHEHKEFLVGFRGYVREEVRAYLRAVAGELRMRDVRIAELERRLDESRPDRERFLDDWVGEVSTLLASQADGRAPGEASAMSHDALRSRLVEVQIVLAGLTDQLAALATVVGRLEHGAPRSSLDDAQPSGIGAAYPRGGDRPPLAPPARERRARARLGSEHRTGRGALRRALLAVVRVSRGRPPRLRAPEPRSP